MNWNGRSVLVTGDAVPPLSALPWWMRCSLAARTFGSSTMLAAEGWKI
jgi:hypothetical protein